MNFSSGNNIFNQMGNLNLSFNSGMSRSQSHYGERTRSQSLKRHRSAGSAKRKRCVLQPPIHTDTVTSMVAVRPGLLLSGSSDKSIVLSKIETAEKVFAWTGHTRDITKLCLIKSEPLEFLSASRDTTVRYWNESASEAVQTFNGHELPVSGIAVPNSKQICSGSRDNTIRLWDIETGACIRTKRQALNTVTHMVYCKTNNVLIQTSEDKEVKLWDPKSLELLQTFPKKTYIQTFCDVSSDGNYCISSSNGFNGRGCELTLWDIRKQSIVHEFFGHEQTVNGVLFVPGTRLGVCSVSTDHSTKFWDAMTTECLWTEHVPSGGALLCLANFGDASLAVGGHHACICYLKILQDQAKIYLDPYALQINTHSSS